MNSPLVEAVQGIFATAWQMMINVRFPGSNIPIAVIIVGAFVIGFAIRILAYVLKMNVNVSGTLEKLDKQHSKRLSKRP